MCCEKMNVFVLLAISLVFMFDFRVSARCFSSHYFVLYLKKHDHKARIINEKLIGVTHLFTYFDKEIYSMGLSDDISNSSEGLTIVPPLCGITKDTSMTLNKQKADHKYCSSLITKVYRMIKTIRSTKFNRNLESYRNENVVSNINDLNLSLNRNNAKHRTVFTPLNLPVLRFLSRLTERERKWSQHVIDVRLQKRSTVDKDDNMGKGMPIGTQRKAKVLRRLLLNNGSGKNDKDIQDDYAEDEDDDYSYGINKKKMNWEDYQNEDGASIMELIALNTRHKTYMQSDEYLYQTE